VGRVTPMIRQYRSIKERHRDCLLLFRLGDFYELFYGDAETAARDLGITLTSRSASKDERIPMAGIPHHSAESYIARLLERGHRVAICEQVEDPKQAKGIVRREVVRVMTPGTVTEDRMLPEGRNNYLVAVACHGGGKGCARHKDARSRGARFGIAAADLSTGEFAVTETEGPGAREAALEELARLAPAECLLPPELCEDERFARTVSDSTGAVVTPRSAWDFDPERARESLASHFGTAGLDGFGCEDKPWATAAAGAILAYVKETQKAGLDHLRGLTTYDRSDFMALDSTTRRNLELTRRILDGSKRGTLLWVLDRTVTAAGARMLRSWIERPLVQVDRINDRLDAVEELYGDAVARAELREHMRGLHDMERLLARASCGSATPRDLAAVRSSLQLVPKVGEAASGLECTRIRRLAESLDPLPELRELLERALVDEPPAVSGAGDLVREGYSLEVDELRRAGREGKEWIASLEARERSRTGIRSLKVGFNKVFGYYIEVTNPNRHLVPDDYTRKQTLASAERYITPDLKEKEALILGAEEKLVSLEYEIFCDLRSRVAAEAQAIQGTARALAEIDVLCSLAEAAVEHGYVRPTVDEGLVIDIVEGRHPVLEQTLDGPFVPNDSLADADGDRLLVVTGPNMAGKSTYLRQVALITIMAQAGSFVPASSARIGIADRIFTRVGATDDLARGQSTFMVEMTEVANILNNATRRSLVVLDEIGRGTSTFDGLSIAWAVSEYIHDRVRSRTLFATHYHELTELERRLDGVVNLSVAVTEDGDDVVFLRKIRRGGTDRSYGIQVARLAGLPPDVISRAAEVLERIENGGDGIVEGAGAPDVTPLIEPGRSRSGSDRGKPPGAAYVEQAFLEVSPHPVVEKLRSLNILKLTPLEALNLLHDLREKAIKGR